MIYKLISRIFGHDYIKWSNSCDRGTARVIIGKNGKIGYWRYKAISVFDVIHKPEQVKWITCKPSKYFKSVEDGNVSIDDSSVRY